MSGELMVLLLLSREDLPIDLVMTVAQMTFAKLTVSRFEPGMTHNTGYVVDWVLDSNPRRRQNEAEDIFVSKGKEAE
jgi:hypothetical protein